MRCNICDRAMTEDEGQFNKDLDTFECCNTCLGIAMDAAYSDGFQYDDDGVVGLDVGEESEDDRVLAYSDLLAHRHMLRDGDE